MNDKNYKAVTCKSGWSVSIQANGRNYCTPRITNAEAYTHVELGFPTASEKLILSYAEDAADPTGTVYGWVPAGLVQALVVKHGGVISGTMPPLDMTPEQAAIMAEALLELGIR
jgi:hypothetical protein